MSISKFIVVFCLVAPAPLCFAVSPQAPPMLPQAFGGWQLSKAPTVSKTPELADPTNAGVLKEYGFNDYEGATYSREGGRTLQIKAARFEDASGAYGAFTFYKMPQMLNEKIGDQASSLNERVLFYKGNILVDAVFQQLSAMSAAELRELAGELPHPIGSTASLPGLPIYLPKQSYVKNSAKYVMGPIALEADSAPLPAEYVNFNKGAEVVLGEYQISGSEATLMLIGYPTPQIAASQFKQIQNGQQQHKFQGSEMMVKRTGPIVVLATGNISEADAKSLLSAVNYDADVTWNENTYFTRRDNAANLIVGVIILAAIICGLGLVAGAVFGGFRLAMKRLFPGRVFDRPEQMEIIALHLSDRVEKPSNPSVSSSVNTG
jgi:hypothetical protein